MRAQLASEIKAVNDQICNDVIYVLISIYPLSSTTIEGATCYEQVKIYAIWSLKLKVFDTDRAQF